LTVGVVRIGHSTSNQLYISETTSELLLSNQSHRRFPACSYGLKTNEGEWYCLRSESYFNKLKSELTSKQTTIFYEKSIFGTKATKIEINHEYIDFIK
jgi:hypothetical protein